MGKSKGDSYSAPTEDTQSLPGVLTRLQSRRLSMQPLANQKETNISRKSLSRSIPKAKLVACVQPDSDHCLVELEEATSVKCFSPKKKNTAVHSPQTKISPTKQTSSITSPKKMKHTFLDEEICNEDKSIARLAPEGIDLMNEIKEEQIVFLDAKEMKTSISNKEKRKLQKLSSNKEPETEVREEIISDISIPNDLEKKKTKKFSHVPVTDNVQEDAHSRPTGAGTHNLKSVRPKSTITPSKPHQGLDISRPTGIESSIIKMSPSKVCSTFIERILPGKEKHLKKKVVIEDNSESDEDSDAESRKEIMRSAEKRIIRNISTSESESRNVDGFKMSTLGKDSTGTDSDSAPEDVTFDASRKSAMDILKHTVDSIKRDKQKKKEKRKERLELLRQQKEENLIRLKERKANLEDASCSSSEESTQEKNGINTSGINWMSKSKKTYFPEDTTGKHLNSRKTVVDNTNVGPSESVDLNHKGALKRLPTDLLENLPGKLPKKMRTAHPNVNKLMVGLHGEKQYNLKSHALKYNRDIDFIPLESSSSTQFGVVTLNTQKLKTVSQQAADFRHNMLYGSRVQRVSTSTLIQKRSRKWLLNSK